MYFSKLDKFIENILCKPDTRRNTKSEEYENLFMEFISSSKTENSQMTSLVNSTTHLRKIE
jgi:hypothetical protein